MSNILIPNFLHGSLLAALALGLLSCGRSERLTIHTGEAHGTTYRIKVPGRARLDQLGIDKLLKQFDRDLSTWCDDSWVAEFNSATAGTTMEMPETVATLLEMSERYHAETGGLFDPTIGALIRIWGFGAWRAGHTADPSEEEITAAREASGFDNLEIDGRQVTKLHDGLMLDFSGIAKGHAVDLIGDILSAAGHTDFLIDFGGDILARGNAPGREQGWKVAGPALESPVTLVNQSIATSGSDHNHRGTHSHIMDPRTGRPVPTGPPVAATADTCAEADARATAAWVGQAAR